MTYLTSFSKYLFLLTLPLLIGGCEVLNNVQINSPMGSTQPNDQEIGMGLKEALNVGISKGVDQLMKTDGYFKNQAIKILLPEEAQKVESIMRRYVPGGDKLVDEAVLKMNRAAEDAAKEAKPIFVDAIKQMTFADARNILFGSENAATTYLRNKTYQQLTAAYAPKINNSLSSVGASQAWEALVNPYNKFANSVAGRAVKDAKPINPDLGAYVTQKALDGLFVKVTEEEKNIRGNLAARSSQLLQRVFGMLDKPILR